MTFTDGPMPQPLDVDEDWDEEVDGPNLARCDYYQDCGICTFGCYEEPACVTSGPWPDPEFTPQESNVIAVRRYAWRMQRWMGWRDLKNWMAERGDDGTHT